MFSFYIMNTVNYDNFFEFGVDGGNAELNEYGLSSPITLSTPIQLLGRTGQTLYVSQLCILSLSFFGVPQNLNLLQGTFTFMEVEIIQYSSRFCSPDMYFVTCYLLDSVRMVVGFHMQKVLHELSK